MNKIILLLSLVSLPVYASIPPLSQNKVNDILIIEQPMTSKDPDFCEEFGQQLAALIVMSVSPNFQYTKEIGVTYSSGQFQFFSDTTGIIIPKQSLEIAVESLSNVPLRNGIKKRFKHPISNADIFDIVNIGYNSCVNVFYNGEEL